MQIAYQSRHGVQSVSIPAIRGHELANWTDGQVRDIPDDLEVLATVTEIDDETGEVLFRGARMAKARDIVLSAGPDFRSLETPDPSGQFAGLHPDYACSSCGQESLSAFYLRQEPSGDVVRTPYKDAAGNFVCPKCYLLTLHDDDVAWRQHEGSLPYAEARRARRAQQREEAAVATAAAAAQPASEAAAAPKGVRGGSIPIAAPTAAGAPVAAVAAPTAAPVATPEG